MIDPAGDEMAVEEFLQRVEREKVELVEKIEEEISGLREGAEQRSKMISQTIEELSRRISVVKTKIKTERGVRTSSREDIRVWAENQVLKTRSFLISEVNHLLKQRENTIETVGRGVQKVAPTISEFCVEQVEGMLQTAIGDVAARFLTAKGDFEIKCGKTESAMKQMMDRLTFVQSSTEEKIKSNHIAVEKAIGNHLQSHTDEALRLLEHVSVFHYFSNSACIVGGKDTGEVLRRSTRGSR